MVVALHVPLRNETIPPLLPHTVSLLVQLLLVP